MTAERGDVGVDTPAPIGAARLLRARWRDVLRALRRAREASAASSLDADHVHALRVASRRAGVSLAMLAPHLDPVPARRARRVLRSLRRAAGVLRDADVHAALFAELTARDTEGRLPRWNS